MKNRKISIKGKKTELRVLWFGGYGDSAGIPIGFFCGYGMGMGIDIQPPRQRI